MVSGMKRNRSSRAVEVLDEDEWASRLASIVKRDFYPHLETLERRLNRHHQVEHEASGGAASDAELSLDAFCARYTGEDNAAFQASQRRTRHVRDMRRHKRGFAALPAPEEPCGETGKGIYGPEKLVNTRATRLGASAAAAVSRHDTDTRRRETGMSVSRDTDDMLRDESLHNEAVEEGVHEHERRKSKQAFRLQPVPTREAVTRQLTSPSPWASPAPSLSGVSRRSGRGTTPLRTPMPTPHAALTPHRSGDAPNGGGTILSEAARALLHSVSSHPKRHKRRDATPHRHHPRDV